MSDGVGDLASAPASRLLDLVDLAAPGWALAALVMFALWLWHLRLRNAGVVDVGWTASLMLIAWLCAVAGPGYSLRRWLLVSMVTVWGVRLIAYLLRDRVIGHTEDPRYADLRARESPVAVWSFFLFFQAQALLAVLLSLPALTAAYNPEPRLSWVEIAAVILFAVAFVGETVADRQLELFKARPGARGKTCRDGLWRYSRHPNYFFEWLIWVSYALYALASPWGVLALVCPALMLYFLFKVTGIPATEAQAVRSRGDDYREYQRTTSAFVPWFPKSGPRELPGGRA